MGEIPSTTINHDMSNIYRILAPVGTCKQDYGIEWIRVEVLVGSYFDAEREAMSISPGCVVEVFDGPKNKWIPA